MIMNKQTLTIMNKQTLTIINKQTLTIMKKQTLTVINKQLSGSPQLKPEYNNCTEKQPRRETNTSGITVVRHLQIEKG